MVWTDGRTQGAPAESSPLTPPFLLPSAIRLLLLIQPDVPTSGQPDVRTWRPDVQTSGRPWTSRRPDVWTSRRPDVRWSGRPNVATSGLNRIAEGGSKGWGLGDAAAPPGPSVRPYYNFWKSITYVSHAITLVSLQWMYTGRQKKWFCLGCTQPISVAASSLGKIC